MPAREQKGLPFEVVLKGRDKTAAFMYKYMRWWIRSNREMLTTFSRRAVMDAILYGRSCAMTEWMKEN